MRMAVLKGCEDTQVAVNPFQVKYIEPRGDRKHCNVWFISNIKHDYFTCEQSVESVQREVDAAMQFQPHPGD